MNKRTEALLLSNTDIILSKMGLLTFLAVFLLGLGAGVELWTATYRAFFVWLVFSLFSGAVRVAWKYQEFHRRERDLIRSIERSRESLVKKEEGQTALNLALARNPDILATLAAPGARRPSLVIGFAAETETIITHAQEKLSRKGADWIVANDVSPDTGIMGGDRTEVHLVTASGVEDWPGMGKDEMAAKLLSRAAEALHDHSLAAE